MTTLVDWDVAARAARRFSPAPPSVSRQQADDTVTELYQAAARAADHVAQLTHLEEPPVTAATRVVDRGGWIDANAGGMRALLTPLVDKLAADNPVGRIAESIGGRVTGVQVGLVLGFLSGKVLGQFEFFDRPGGQLLLVAPNLVAVERQLEVDPSDFRLWVCLHEVTHRVQFTAVPWLREHMHDEVEALTAAIDTDPAAMRQRLSGAVGELVKVARGQGDGVGAARRPRDARATRDPRPRHRLHVAGRGARRVRHERRAGRRHPDPAGDREAVRRAAAHAAATRSTGCCAACSAWRRRPASTPTVRRSCARSSTASASTTSTRSGPPARRCRPRPRSAIRSAGSRACTPNDVGGAAPGGRRGPLGRPRRARRPSACWSRAPAARTRSPSPRRSRSRRRVRACRPAFVTVDHGLQRRFGRAGAARSRAAGLRARFRPGPDRAGDRRDGRRVRGGGADGPLRRAAASAADGRDVLLGHTLDDQAESVLLGLGRGSGPRSVAGMRVRDGALVRPLLGRAAGDHGRGVRGAGTAGVGRPGQRRPALPAGPVAARGAAAARGRAAGRRRRGARPHRVPAAGRPRRARRPGRFRVAPRIAAFGGAAPIRGAKQVWTWRSWPHCPARCAPGCCGRGRSALGATECTAVHTAALDALVTAWHGQGAVDLPGGVRVARASGRLERVSEAQ